MNGKLVSAGMGGGDDDTGISGPGGHGQAGGRGRAGSCLDTPASLARKARPSLDRRPDLYRSGCGPGVALRLSCALDSARLITQQSGSADQWLDLIRWMQQKQNLWQFEPATEDKIVAYLADNYPPQANRRRAAIPRELMPPNPYAREKNEGE